MNAYRLTVATAVATFILLLVGGTVNPTGSSLACPDWPTCYGSFFPEMKGGVLYEHTHRLVATAVGLLTLAVAFTTWRSRPAGSLARRLGIVSVVLVIAQGVLGGLTVIFKLPMLVSTAHLGVSMIFFLVLLRLGWELHDETSTLTATEPIPRMPALVATAAVYVQILLGGLVRHTMAGRACLDAMPLCTGGVLWPDWGPAQLHMLHRIAGVLVFGIVVWAHVLTIKTARAHNRPAAGMAALAAPALVFVQIILGVVTVTSFIGVIQVVAHLGIAAMLLADTAFMYMALGPAVEREAGVVSAPAPAAIES